MENPPINRAKVKGVLAGIAVAALVGYVWSDWRAISRSASEAYGHRTAHLWAAEQQAFDACKQSAQVATEMRSCVDSEALMAGCGQYRELHQLSEAMACRSEAERKCSRVLEPCGAAAAQLRHEHRWQRDTAKTLKWINWTTIAPLLWLAGALLVIYRGEAAVSRVSRWFRS
jgi:hypothetical protein